MEQDKRKQRLSHLFNLISVAYSDGYMDKVEKEIIITIARRIGMSQSEINEVTSNPDNIELYVPKSLAKKIEYLYDLVLIVFADGKIDDKEIYCCRIVAEQYGLEANIIDRLVKKLVHKVTEENDLDVKSELLNELGYPSENIENEALFEKIMFISTDHIRYQNGTDVSGHNYNCKRGVKIEPNISGNLGYTVTIYNMDGNNLVWGNNIQMAPKQMRIESQSDNKIVLRGWGSDNMGNSFADYGMTIFLEDGHLEKAVLHMHDRGIDIEYLK